MGLIVASMSLTALAQTRAANDVQRVNSTPAFSYDKTELPNATPWTAKKFKNNPRNFQFTIIGDRTGKANVQETFEIAMGQINLLQPEFVINVGDVIEGYSDEKNELHAEWDEVDKLLNILEMPFSRTPGNHDIANAARM